MVDWPLILSGMYCFHLRELSCRTSKDAGNHLTEFVDSHSNSRTADSFLKTLITESYLYFSPNQSIVDIPFLGDCPRTVITFKRWHFKYGPDNVQIWRLTGGGGEHFLFCTAPLPRPVRGRAEGLSFREQWIYTRQ